MDFKLIYNRLNKSLSSLDKKVWKLYWYKPGVFMTEKSEYSLVSIYSKWDNNSRKSVVFIIIINKWKNKKLW